LNIINTFAERASRVALRKALLSLTIYEINKIVPETKIHASHFSAQVVVDPDGILDPYVMGFHRENGIRLNVRRYIIFAITTWPNN
jgi:hypothetical protein